MFNRRSASRASSAAESELVELRRRVTQLEDMLERITTANGLIVDVRGKEPTVKKRRRAASGFAEAWSRSEVVFASDGNFFDGIETDDRARRWLLSSNADRDVA